MSARSRQGQVIALGKCSGILSGKHCLELGSYLCLNAIGFCFDKSPNWNLLRLLLNKHSKIKKGLYIEFVPGSSGVHMILRASTWLPLDPLPSARHGSCLHAPVKPRCKSWCMELLSWAQLYSFLELAYWCASRSCCWQTWSCRAQDAPRQARTREDTLASFCRVVEDQWHGDWTVSIANACQGSPTEASNSTSTLLEIGGAQTIHH